MEPGASVSAIARRIGIDPSQLFTWRRNARLKAEAAVDTARDESSTADIMIGDCDPRECRDRRAHLVRLIPAVRSA
ncbi:IS66 family insertion sequence transposase domain-containing protein (plasmid) [Sinorhizobium fredii]|uniref:IS66 family insertion sequence transposase domain-containing protein n=1 Tax=Rhizobium fredii TaxID=380 RepID=A0A2L0HBS7_RHIFR|nr:IS66 family insertion sequence transposase domain-containing protein [Sinorhizobium fredii]